MLLWSQRELNNRNSSYGFFDSHECVLNDKSVEGALITRGQSENWRLIMITPDQAA